MPPSAFPGDVPITPDVVKQHKLDAEELERMKRALGREPTYTELGVFSVMWSEHCSYKSSRFHLKRLPTKGPRVTADVSLAGRFLVYMPFAARVGVSRKIGDRAERARLRKMVEEILPEDSGGVIIRTVS